MKVRLVTCWVVAVIAAAACGDRVPMSPSPVSVQAVSAAAVSTVRSPVPLVGTLAGQTYEDPTLPCPGPPPHLATVSVGVGNVSHLGLASLRSQHCFVGLNPDGSLRLRGSAVFLAPNGDQLHADYSGDLYGYSPGSVPTGPITASGPVIVTGGTGRFEDASGEGEFTVEVRPTSATPWPIQFELKASVVY